MTKFWPLKFRPHGDGLLFADDAGGYFKSTGEFLSRYALGRLTAQDGAFLATNGQAFEESLDLDFLSFATRWARRLHFPKELNYAILVPTLRCDLECDYCQVSRVHRNAKGFDWSDDTLNGILRWLEGLATRSIKIEFQGGEPLLRLDLLRAVRDFCRSKFEQSQFVVCTNLQKVSEDAWEFLSANDTFISTSLDGDLAKHQKNRTKGSEETEAFWANISHAVGAFPEGKVSALPTIDPADPPTPRDVLNHFGTLNLNSIYLRRVNFQGLARKKYAFDTVELAWQRYYRSFIEEIVNVNFETGTSFEEYYMTFLLKRILRGGHNNHVDLRNPSWLAEDYMLVDFDGRLYPTDEARMVSRIGKIDLSIGTISTGINQRFVDTLNAAAVNQLDPECQHCVYQAYCGLDVVDDLARYGRIDLPRHETSHCRNHLFLFDYAFELLYSRDERVQSSLAKWLDLGRFPSTLQVKHA